MLRTRFTELVGCDLPFQQAAMGRASGFDLAAAVARAGGLAMVAVDGRRSQAETISELVAARAGVVGANFLVPFLRLRDDIDQLLEATASAVRVVEFFYDDPVKDWVQLVKGRGALAAWQVGSAAEAISAQECGCDFVVAQGVEAGGHVRGALGLLPLLDAVLETVDIPVVAAGGIATARSMAAALAAGADAVRVGTRLVATVESEAHPRYKQMLVDAGHGDTVLTETFAMGWANAPHRVLRSSVHAAEALGGKDSGIDHDNGGGSIPALCVATPTAGVTGRIEAMACYAGQSVGSIHSIEPAEALIRGLVEDAEALLGRWATNRISL